MKSQRYIHLVVGAVLLGSLTRLSAQEPAPAPAAPQGSDTVQGYSPPAEAAPVPAPAPSRPFPARAAFPAAAPQTVAQALGFIDVIPARDPERIQRQLDLAKSNAREADANWPPPPTCGPGPRQ